MKGNFFCFNFTSHKFSVLIIAQTQPLFRNSPENFNDVYLCFAEQKAIFNTLFILPN